MLKPSQKPSWTQLSEQSCSEDGDIVLFAVSSTRITGPFCDFLNFRNDITRTESRAADVTPIIIIVVVIGIIVIVAVVRSN